MQRVMKATNVVLILLCAMYFISYIVRQNVSTAIIEIRPEFGLTNTEAGLIFSAFGYPYLLFQIIGGVTADRFGPRLTLFVSGLVWAGATVLTSMAWDFYSLFFARVLMGFGVGATLPTATRAMQHWVESKKRGYAQGITHAFSRLGNALTPALIVTLMALGMVFGGFFAERRLRDRLEDLDRRTSTGPRMIQMANLRRVEKPGRLPTLDKLLWRWFPNASSIRQKLQTTGMNVTLGDFAFASLALAMAMAFLLYIVLDVAPVIALVGSLLVGVGLPNVVVGWKAKKRARKFNQLFPEAVDLVVIGPEAPLDAGVSDRLRQAGLPVIGSDALGSSTDKIIEGVSGKVVPERDFGALADAMVDMLARPVDRARVRAAFLELPDHAHQAARLEDAIACALGAHGHAR
mgnify:CR=1 FL=1